MGGKVSRWRTMAGKIRALEPGKGVYLGVEARVSLFPLRKRNHAVTVLLHANDEVHFEKRWTIVVGRDRVAMAL